MTPITYDEVISQLKTILAVEMNDEDINFTRIIPSMMLYADGRIYRELSFLSNKITQPITLNVGVRETLLPATVRTLRAMNVFTTLAPLTPSSKRKPLERISAEMLDFVWPQSSYKMGVPEKYAIVGNLPQAGDPANPFLIRLMPTPDKAYAAELLGAIRPDPLSPENPQTYLSVFYPELLIAACMVYGTGYQRDFGAQADDPSRSVSWESTYNGLKAGVLLEVARMRGIADEAPNAPAPAV